MPTLDTATSPGMNGATVAPEIIEMIHRYLAVETRRREEAIRALAKNDQETGTRLERLETICRDGFGELKKNTAIAKSGRGAARTTAVIAAATAVGWVASHYDQLADVLRFLGRFFR